MQLRCGVAVAMAYRLAAAASITPLAQEFHMQQLQLLKKKKKTELMQFHQGYLRRNVMCHIRRYTMPAYFITGVANLDLLV